MEKDWQCIYTTANPVEAEIIKSMLAENEIEAVLLNKKDSSYLAFGEVELYVNRSHVLQALNLIKQHRENE